jgi:hypothetical protein
MYPNAITFIVMYGSFLAEDTIVEKQSNQNRNVYLPYFLTRAVMMLTAPDL